MIDFDQAVSLLDYEPNSGVFTWKRPVSNRPAGSVAGSVNAIGYHVIAIAGKDYGAHRIAYLMMTGRKPPSAIDHINGIRSDNRWENLRLATTSQNAMNADVRADSCSGLRNISKVGSRWRVKLKGRGVVHHVGYFETAMDAIIARNQAALLHQGPYARLVAASDALDRKED